MFETEFQRWTLRVLIALIGVCIVITGAQLQMEHGFYWLGSQ